ncbi:hypothetical protein DB346_11405 [Verrucomicrobia bacterium LW23]|nr:hypothetical protein DB346_11405 [Verrucomicrobia bacterium LW23]
MRDAVIHFSDLSGTLFDDACLQGATFSNVNMQGVKFNDINLSGASFININLSGASLSDINLSGVAITDACLEGMTINGILVTDLLKAHKAAASAQGTPPPAGTDAAPGPGAVSPAA